MESVTGQGVRYIYTHAHPDHCNGASLLEDAVVVAHEYARKNSGQASPLPDISSARSIRGRSGTGIPK